MVCFNHRNSADDLAAMVLRGLRTLPSEPSELVDAWDRLLDATNQLVEFLTADDQETGKTKSIDPEVTKLVISVLSRCQSLRWLYESELEQKCVASSQKRSLWTATKSKLQFELYCLQDKLGQLAPVSPESAIAADESLWIESATQLAENFFRLLSRDESSPFAPRK